MIQEFSFEDISYNVRTCMTSCGAKKPVKLKIVYKKKIQIFVLNMPFISSCKREKVYFILTSPLMRYAFFALLHEIFIPRIFFFFFFCLYV